MSRPFKRRESVVPQRVQVRSFQRSENLMVRFTPGEVADIQVIAHHWKVPKGTVVWAVFAEYLSKLRGRELSELPWSDAILEDLERIGRLHPAHKETE